MIISLINELAERGFDVVVASGGGAWLARLDKASARYLVPLYPSTPINIIRSAIELDKILRSESIDIINSHHRFSTLVCNILSVARHIPVVSTVHEIKQDYFLFSRLVFGEQNIVFSDAVKKSLEINYNVNETKIHKVSLGIDFEIPSQEVVDLTKSSLGLSDVIPLVACVARLSEEKGCEVYLKAVAKILDRGIEAQFLLVGDGPLGPELKQLSENLMLGEAMRFTGWRDDVIAILAQVDFLVLPSLSEGLGITILEAAALSKPTIASCVGGIPEVIQDRKTGLLVPAGDVEELAKAISYLLTNRGIAEELGNSANQGYVRNFSSAIMVDKTVAVYEKILTGELR